MKSILANSTVLSSLQLSTNLVRISGNCSESLEGECHSKQVKPSGKLWCSSIQQFFNARVLMLLSVSNCLNANPSQNRLPLGLIAKLLILSRYILNNSRGTLAEWEWGRNCRHFILQNSILNGSSLLRILLEVLTAIDFYSIQTRSTANRIPTEFQSPESLWELSQRIFLGQKIFAECHKIWLSKAFDAAVPNFLPKFDFLPMPYPH